MADTVAVAVIEAALAARRRAFRAERWLYEHALEGIQDLVCRGPGFGEYGQELFAEALQGYRDSLDSYQRRGRELEAEILCLGAARTALLDAGF